MNWIELLNKFYDLLQETRVSHNAQLLYYTLLQINNRCSWIEWFARTNVNLSGLTGLSEKALTNARNELKQLGLIDFVSSKKRGECTKYSILYSTKDSTKEVQKKYKGSTKEVQSADIIKPKPKLKLKEEKNEEISYDKIIEQYIESQVLKDALIEFIKMRKLKDKSLTNHALKLAIDKLFKLSNNLDEQIEIVNQSILNSWKGFFPLQNKGGNLNGNGIRNENSTFTEDADKKALQLFRAMSRN